MINYFIMTGLTGDASSKAKGSKAKLDKKGGRDDKSKSVDISRGCSKNRMEERFETRCVIILLRGYSLCLERFGSRLFCRATLHI